MRNILIGVLIASLVWLNTPLLRNADGQNAAAPIYSGQVLLLLANSCPAGTTESSALNGKYILGTVAANGDVGSRRRLEFLHAHRNKRHGGFHSRSTNGTVAFTPAGTNGTVSFTPAGSNASGAYSEARNLLACECADKCKRRFFRRRDFLARRRAHERERSIQRRRDFLARRRAHYSIGERGNAGGNERHSHRGHNIRQLGRGFLWRILENCRSESWQCVYGRR